MYLQITRYEMTQSSCKRDSKSKSHPGMKLAPVRVFSCKHPLILKILFVIDCGETFFFLKTHLEEKFFEGGYDVMMIRTSASESIIYSKEKDNWIINWPTDTASQTNFPFEMFFPFVIVSTVEFLFFYVT